MRVTQQELSNTYSRRMRYFGAINKVPQCFLCMVPT